MRYFFSAFRVALWVVLSCNLAVATEIMPLSEVKDGMKGYGVTVFKGQQLEQFGVEIVGVLHNFRPHRSMILAKLSGEVVERTGVIAGMSGSPVYIDGRQIGAVAYAWPFDKEAVAGITPIADILAVSERQAGRSSSLRLLAAVANDFMATSGLSGAEKELLTRVLQPAAGADNVTAAGVSPLPLPLALSGFSARTISRFPSLQLASGNIPISSGTSAISAGEGKATGFTPGDAIGVQLVGGDLSITGVGTVSYTDGDKVWAFGHPMMMLGATSLPMTTATVHYVHSSLNVSFKFASAVEVVGTIVQDREAAIMGVWGQDPDMIPVRVSYQADGVDQTSNYKLVRDQNLSPVFFLVTLLSILDTNEKMMTDAAATLAAKIEIEGQVPLVIHRFFSHDHVASSLAVSVFEPLAALLLNTQEEVRVKSIAIEISYNPRLQRAVIESVSVPSTVVAAGEKLQLKVVLRPYRSATQTIETAITIPQRYRGQQLLLMVSDVNNDRILEQRRARGKYQQLSVAELIKYYGELPDGRTLVVKLLDRRSGVIIGNKELPEIPASKLALLRDSSPGGNVKGTLFQVPVRASVATDWDLVGQKVIPIQIKQGR